MHVQFLFKSIKSHEFGSFHFYKSDDLFLNITVKSKKKCTNLQMSYIFEKTTDFDNIFGEDPDRLQVFFAHIFKSIGPILKKLRAKMYFFTFSKMVKTHP